MSGLQLLSEGRLWAYRGKVILTDPPESTRVDAVFPLCHENMFFVEHLTVPQGARVLDLCTGSGILALFAAENAARVVATDINPRALEFARLNAGLNGVEHKVTFLQGDLFTPVNGTKFDLILTNPPFEPTPPGCGNYLHSDGGIEGSAVIERILEQFDYYLNPGGRFQMIAYVSESKLDLIEQLGKLLTDRLVLTKLLKTFRPETFQRYQHRQLMRLRSERVPVGLIQESIHYLFVEVKRKFSTEATTWLNG